MEAVQETVEMAELAEEELRKELVSLMEMTLRLEYELMLVLSSEE